jgi:dienelactone hydrolase
MGHGFCNAPENYRNFGALLASRGIAVVVPKLECNFLAFSDSAKLQLHTGNAQRMLSALDAALALDSRLDGTTVALSGHSGGGLSALLAAGMRPSVRALALLDAVDASTGARSSPVPALMISTAPAQCNASGNSSGWYGQVQAGVARSRMRVVGASHCDMQEPVHSSCSFAGCAGSNPAAVRPVFLRHTAAWLVAHLSCDAAAAQATALSGADLQADLQAGRLADVVQDLDGNGADDVAGALVLPLPATCPPPTSQDAGTPSVDAGTATDAGAVQDAGALQDAGAGGGGVDAGPGQVDAGGGTPATPDAGAEPGPAVDAGAGQDGGEGPAVTPPFGCGVVPGLPAWAALALAAAARGRRKRL